MTTFLSTFAAFFTVIMAAIVLGASVVAALSLFRDWLRDKLDPGARQAAMDAHPAGSRFVATWNHAGTLTSIAGQHPDAWLEQQRGRS